MTKDKPLRVLVVDDTIVYRKIVSDVLTEMPDVEVVGTANNGRIAVSKISSLKPDLLTLDVEMPEMDGIQVLEYLKKESLDIGAIMVSSLTQKGGDMTIRALELGAFDFIPKPQKSSIEENREEIKKTIAPMLKAFSRQSEIRSILGAKSTHTGSSPGMGGSPIIRKPGKPLTVVSNREQGKSDIVAIGVSTGGPNALAMVIPKLPIDLGVPVLVVQHMPPVFTQSLAKSLDSKSAIAVKEAVDGENIRPNTVFIAPGGKQMKVVANADGKNRLIRITDDPPENSCKPSVDYLLRAVAHQYMGRATGVIMTGMGSDGTTGLKLMRRNGSTIIAQNESTCVVYGMPKGPVDAGIVDVIAPLDSIAEEIRKTVK
ncbi:MAG: chemotaxis response regulator protein-glutamate methylesterase [Thermodesulfobacteriota bacterium]|nr:chemotaxis response regulator protein-glutamate methylesterase [Thermodesulfobacteriota bacterium]